LTALISKRTAKVVAVIVAALGIVAVVVLSVGDSASIRAFDLYPYEWLVPLLAAVAMGALAWVLLGTVERPATEHVPDDTSCGTCGEELRQEWKLCPRCGTFVDGTQPGTAHYMTHQRHEDERRD
jgi:hypothetical protein